MRKFLPIFLILIITIYVTAGYCASNELELANLAFDAGDYYRAFSEYQKVIEQYPNIENRKEIIKRQYEIGVLFYEGQRAKVMGILLVPALDKAVEIFEKVIINAPYGEYADKSQFKIGQCYSKESRFTEAVEAFQRLIDDYPRSALLDDARYEIAHSSYKASLDPDYNQEITDEAIREFEKFVMTSEKSPLSEDAGAVLNELREKKAKHIFDIAAFYEKQKQLASAAVYYKDVVDKYPDTSLATEALSKYTELEKKAKGIEEERILKEMQKERNS